LPPERKRLLLYEDQKTLKKELKSHLSHMNLNEIFAFKNQERFPLEAELAGWPVYSLHSESQRWKLSKYQVSSYSPTLTEMNSLALFHLPADS